MRIGSVIRRAGRSFVVEDEDVAVTTVTLSETQDWEKLSSIHASEGRRIRSSTDLNFGDVVRNRFERNDVYVVACITKKVVAVYATTISAYDDWKILEP